MLLVIAIAASFAASLAAKLLVDHYLLSRVAVLGSFAGLQYSTNSGIAFSITFPWHLQAVFIAIALLAILAAALLSKTQWSAVAFGLILGGALENVTDRLFDGKVTDFVQIGTFPVFNVADSCITIGVALLLLEAVLQWRKNSAS